MNKKAYGFTIVELLIVIVVIGILAAITIVTYSGIQNRAHDMAVKNDLGSFQKKIAMYKVEFESYPVSTDFMGALSAVSFKVSKGSYMTDPTTAHNFIYCMNYDGSTVLDYAIVAFSRSGNKFRASAGSEAQEYVTTWTDQTVACQDAMASSNANYRGYAADDMSNGPWRAWVGGA